MKIRFEEQSHQYFDETGRHIPGVTNILKAGGLIDFTGIPEGKLEDARFTGTNVHKICELWDRGQLDEDSLDERGKLYLASWQKFRADYGIDEFEGIETIVFSPIFMYCGTLDRVFEYGKKTILADIKTGAPGSLSVGPQTAAYQYAWQKMTGKKIDARWEINLDEVKPRPHKLADKSDMAVFLACRTIWIHKQNNNKGDK